MGGVAKAVGGVAQTVFGGGGKAGLMGTGSRNTSDVNVDTTVKEDKNYDARRKDNQARLGQVDQRDVNRFNMKAANIDKTGSDEFRNDQRSLVSDLQAQSDGTGPSLAQNQLQRGTDRNLAQIMAAQASAGGQGAGLAMRNIARNQAIATQQAAGQSADLRLNEQLQARNQLAQALTSGRGQDMDLAAQQAQLNQQASLANQQEQAQQQAQKDAMVQYYLNRGMNMDEAQRQAAIQVEGLKVGVATGNVNRQEAENQRAQQATSDLVGGVMKGGATALMMSDETMKTDIAPVTKPNTQDNFLDKLKAGYKKMNEANKTEDDKKVDNRSSQAKAGEAVGSAIGSMFASKPAAAAASDESVKTAVLPVDMKALAGEAPIPQKKESGGGGMDMGSIMKMIGPLLEEAGPMAAAASDKTSKKDKKEIKTEVEKGDTASDFLNAIKGFTYKYKDPMKYGEGVNMGLMAQDLAEAGPIGKAMVMRGPDGKLIVDYGKGFGAVLATVSNVNERLKELEKKKGKK